MREFIIENLANMETIHFGMILLNNAVTLAASLFIMFTYKLTYSGAAYSRKFNISLGMITIITTMIMSVISNNIALSLGMVGALSIIRFRTAVKDVRDAAFIFWGIAVGIGCGVSQFSLVGVGSLTLFVFMVCTRQVMTENRQLLIVQGDLSAQNKIEAAVQNHFSSRARRTMKNASEGMCESVYSISEGMLKKAEKKHMVDIVQKLMELEGVRNVNLIDQLDDVSR